VSGVSAQTNGFFDAGSTRHKMEVGRRTFPHCRRCLAFPSILAVMTPMSDSVCDASIPPSGPQLRLPRTAA
jgi:hypothetical protein